MNKRLKECPHAPLHAVFCETQQCEKCGWNPVVAEARLEAFKQKLYGEVSNGEANSMGENP